MWQGGVGLVRDCALPSQAGFPAVSTPSTRPAGPPQVRLAVAGAFHTSYMAPAAAQLEAALAATHIVAPRIPVISNVDAQPHSDPAVIKKILAQQVRARPCLNFELSCARSCTRVSLPCVCKSHWVCCKFEGGRDLWQQVTPLTTFAFSSCLTPP